MPLTSSRLSLHLAGRRLSWTSTASSELTTPPTLEAVDTLPLTLCVWLFLSVCHCLTCHFLIDRWLVQAGMWFDRYNSLLLTPHRHSTFNGADAEYKRTNLNPRKPDFPKPSASPSLINITCLLGPSLIILPLVVSKYVSLHVLVHSRKIRSKPVLTPLSLFGCLLTSSITLILTRLWLVDINAVYIWIFEVPACVKYLDT